MTIAPIPPAAPGPLATSDPIPDFWLHQDEGEFVAAMLTVRKRALAGKSTLTDKQLTETWLRTCSRTGSEETRKTYARHLNRYRLFLRRRLGLGDHEQTDEALLAPGDPDAVIDFAGEMRQMTETLKPNGKPLLSPATYNATLAGVSSFYKWCSQPTNRAATGIPMSPVPSGLQLQKQAKRAVSLNSEQLANVYFGARALKAHNSNRDEVILRLLYFLGTRASETINLRWDDITQSDSGPIVHVRKGKGSKERHIACEPVLNELLQRLQELQPKSEWLLPNMQDPSGHISRQWLWTICNRAGKKVGLKTWTHLFRHTHATDAYRLTKDVKLVQCSLGHADPSVTLNMYVDELDGESSARALMRASGTGS